MSSALGLLDSSCLLVSMLPGRLDLVVFRNKANILNADLVHDKADGHVEVFHGVEGAGELGGGAKLGKE